MNKNRPHPRKANSNNKSRKKENKACRNYTSQQNLLSKHEILENLRHIPDWEYSSQEASISCRFEFPNFSTTMEFVNLLAELAEREDHHPELHISYRFCTVNYATHSLGGVSMNDFICAELIDRIYTNTN